MFKITLVANTSWSIFNFRLGLLRHLKNEGYEVSVIAPKDQFSSKLIAEGIEYHEIKMSNYGTNPFKDLILIYNFYKLYKSINPSLIFHYTIKPNIYGTIAASVCRIKSVMITTGLGHLFKFKSFIVRWITLLLYRFSAMLTFEAWFLNENDRDIFVYKDIISKKKTKILNSEGINLKWFSPRREKRYFRDRFLYAGRLIWDKGINEYVEAAKIIKSKYPKTKFELLGFVDQSNPIGVPYKTIKEWQKGGIIRYLGETDDVRPFIQRATCFVFPSYYREGVSRVLMEAAAMETPIITTDNIGCRDIVDHGKNGFIVSPKNVVELAHALESFILLDHNDKKVMGKLGRQKMLKSFDENLIISNYVSFINKIGLGNPDNSQTSERKNMFSSTN